MHHTVALFGESEKGDYRTAYFVESLGQLVDCLGNPPADTHGLYYAVQALLYRRGVIFFRVREEGFSLDDYLTGLHFLKNREVVPTLSAVCLPGMGNADVLEASEPVCKLHDSLLITSQRDLYDYLTYCRRS